MCCSVLQCVAVCCSVLQCVVVCYSVLQCVVVCTTFSAARAVESWACCVCIVCASFNNREYLLCTSSCAVCCSVLQCVAVLLCTSRVVCMWVWGVRTCVTEYICKCARHIQSFFLSHSCFHTHWVCRWVYM